MYEIVTITGNRSVTFTVAVDSSDPDKIKQLALTASHVKGGRYRVSILRQIRSGMFVRFRVYQDSEKPWYEDHGARYSNKNLDIVAAHAKKYLEDALNGTESAMISWAKEVDFA